MLDKLFHRVWIGISPHLAVTGDSGAPVRLLESPESAIARTESGSLQKAAAALGQFRRWVPSGSQ